MLETSGKSIVVKRCIAWDVCFCVKSKLLFLNDSRGFVMLILNLSYTFSSEIMDHWYLIKRVKLTNINETTWYTEIINVINAIICNIILSRQTWMYPGSLTYLYPSILQTTVAARSLNRWLHIYLHSSLCRICTWPLRHVLLFTRRMSTTMLQ